MIEYPSDQLFLIAKDWTNGYWFAHHSGKQMNDLTYVVFIINNLIDRIPAYVLIVMFCVCDLYLSANSNSWTCLHVCTKTLWMSARVTFALQIICMYNRLAFGISHHATFQYDHHPQWYRLLYIALFILITIVFNAADCN